MADLIADSPEDDAEYRRGPSDRGVLTKVQCVGLELSRTIDIVPTGGGIWKVGKCKVNFPRKTGTCDWHTKSRPRMRCPEWWAVAYALDPPTPEELVQPDVQLAKAVQPTVPAIILATELPDEDALEKAARARVHGGYSRFKEAYNRALTSEFRDTMFFIRNLFPDIAPPLDSRVQKIRGPRNMPLADMLFAAFTHSHLNWSFRRTEGFLEFLADPEINFIKNYPGFNALNDFVRAAESTVILRDVLALTAEPFRRYGKMTIAADGTDFNGRVATIASDAVLVPAGTAIRSKRALIGAGQYAQGRFNDDGAGLAPRAGSPDSAALAAFCRTIGTVTGLGPGAQDVGVRAHVATVRPVRVHIAVQRDVALAGELDLPAGPSGEAAGDTTPGAPRYNAGTTSARRARRNRGLTTTRRNQSGRYRAGTFECDRATGSRCAG